MYLSIVHIMLYFKALNPKLLNLISKKEKLYFLFSNHTLNKYPLNFSGDIYLNLNLIIFWGYLVCPQEYFEWFLVSPGLLPVCF